MSERASFVVLGQIEAGKCPLRPSAPLFFGGCWGNGSIQKMGWKRKKGTLGICLKMRDQDRGMDSNGKLAGQFYRPAAGGPELAHGSGEAAPLRAQPASVRPELAPL